MKPNQNVCQEDKVPCPQFLNFVSPRKGSAQISNLLFNLSIVKYSGPLGISKIEYAKEAAHHQTSVQRPIKNNQ